MDDGFSSSAHAPGTLVPGTDPDAAALLGGLWLRDPAALRHGGRRRHLSPRHHAARARPKTMECGLCAAVAAAEGWSLRRKSQPAAALLPVPGDPEAVAAGHSGTLFEIARRDRRRFTPARHPLCRGRLGKPDARRLGAGLGVLVRRHGSVAVHLFPAGRGRRMRAGRGRTHLRPRAARLLSAGRRQHHGSQLQRPRGRREGQLSRCVLPGRTGIFAAQFRIRRHRDAVRAIQDGRGSLQQISRSRLERRQARGASDGTAGLRPVHQGEPRLQPARRPWRDLGNRTAELHHARARTRQGLRRSLDAYRSGRGGLMPDLLLELFSEEIPARMQARAADDLRRMVTDKLVAEGLVYEAAKAFATPRRLTLTVHGIPARQSDLKEERKGPRVGWPDAAIAGFLKATGLTSLDQAKIQRDPKKGDFYIALIEKPGRATLDVLADMLPVIVRTFPWPKSMRWGERSAKPGALNWVRPLHAITATFGLETEEPDVVKFEIAGIEAGQTTYGHRFMAPAAIPVRRFEDYEAKLLDAKVVLDPQRRKDTILTDARQLAFAQGYELVEDQALLDEVAGLVEWPVVLMGSFDREFLSIPGEVIRATIRNNQKCFVVSDPKTGRLTNKFILTANIDASDGGKVIIAGNERVIRARLSDAKFFYDA